MTLNTVDNDPLSVLQGHSITYRIALGLQAGRQCAGRNAWKRVFTIDIDACPVCGGRMKDIA